MAQDTFKLGDRTMVLDRGRYKQEENIGSRSEDKQAALRNSYSRLETSLRKDVSRKTDEELADIRKKSFNIAGRLV